MCEQRTSPKYGTRRTGPRLWLLIAIAALGPVFVLLINVNLYWGPPLTKRAHRFRAAQEAFRSSRTGEPDTYEFLTFGLRRGMSECGVEKVLPTPIRILRHAEPDSGRNEGFANVYFFEWGPTQSLASATPLCSETLYVHFDREGHATSVVLLRFGQIPLFGEKVWELELRPKE